MCSKGASSKAKDYHFLPIKTAWLDAFVDSSIVTSRPFNTQGIASCHYGGGGLVKCCLINPNKLVLCEWWWENPYWVIGFVLHTAPLVLGYLLETSSLSVPWIICLNRLQRLERTRATPRPPQSAFLPIEEAQGLMRWCVIHKCQQAVIALVLLIVLLWYFFLYFLSSQQLLNMLISQNKDEA